MAAGLWALCFSCSSQSEVVYGTSTATGLNWVMTNILPAYTGLEVNGLVYQYTTVKDPESEMVVYVQNENAQGDGYIFQFADNWTGQPGNTIRRKFVMPNILSDFWGDGSITWTGEGSVEDANVIYTYKYDSCFDPQSDPACPGYKDEVEVPDIPFVDPLNDEFVIMQMEQQAKIDAEAEEDDRRRRQKESTIDAALENLLGDGINPKLVDLALQAKALSALYRVLPVDYYDPLDGGEYLETIKLNGGEIQDNRQGRQAVFRQQALHDAMVNSQYER